jgi:hypothetical protein
MPLILDDASLKIGTDDTPTSLAELACVTNHLELSPDVAVTTLDTMCGSVDYPGVVKWSLVATLYQSLEPGATEDILSQAVEADTAVPFEIVPYKSKPVGPDNPSWSGMVIPQPYSPINGDAGDASTIDLEWSVVGQPTKSETDAATAAASAASDLQAMTRAQLDDQATALGLNPADYATKDDEIAAIQAAQPTQVA